MSAYAIEFMLENCSELKNPSVRPRQTISADGVAGVTSENRPMVRPIMSVFTTSTCLNPKRPQDFAAQ